MRMNVHDPKSEKHGAVHVTKNVWFMFKYTFKYAPGYIWVTLIEAFGRAGWHILGVLFTKYLFDAIEKGVDFREILTVVLAVTAYNAIFELFNKWMLEVYRPRANLALHEGMQKELYAKARSLDQKCYDDPSFYNDFVWAIRESDSRTVRMMVDLSLFLNRIISSVVIFGVLASMDLIVAVALLAAVGLGTLLKLVQNKVSYQKSLEINPIGRKLGYIARVFYLHDYAKELRQGSISNKLCEEYEKTTEEEISVIKKYTPKLFWLGLLSGIIMSVVPSIGVVGYLIVRYILDPALSLGSFSASITASFKLFWTIDDIGNYLVKYNEHSLYVEKFRRFIEYEPEIRGEESNIEAFECLSIRNMSFAYPFSDKGDVLKNISIDIKRGEKIAFVGYNGAGKTTLTKLLMRLYDAGDGQILYNGRDIRDFVPEEYRKHIGAVFQDYKIFAATVAENVLGDRFAPEDEERVMFALRAVSFEDKLATLPQGIHSQLTREFSKDGVGLSGGEGQKIAIARTFARPYELVIMDEPSSALDPIAEYNLNRSIAENAADKTVIFISHRLSTTRMADRIYMFENGTIIESGSHDELMAQKGKYAEMYLAQAKKYRTENQL